MSKKLSKLRAILSSLPAKAMVQIAPKEVQDYVSFTSEAGSLRLYKFLCPTAPLKLYDRTLTRRYENGTDIIEVNPSDSTRCAGLISDTILYPGQEIILEAETGLTGTVEARPLEDPSDPGESSK